MSVRSQERPQLFADRGCPFAHRVLSLLAHLDVDYDLAEAPVGHRPDGLEHWSPSGRIPLLVHGDLAIGESRVILEYLAEAYGFKGAYPASLSGRTAHRHAMVIVDEFVTPCLFSEERARQDRLAECLDILTDVTHTWSLMPCLLSFHLAPVWVRFVSWSPKGVVTRAVRQRPQLERWLDAAAQLAPVERTAILA